MDRLLDVEWGACPPFGHGLDWVTDSTCAWSEGWAYFVPHLVDKSQLLNDTNRLVDLERGSINNSTFIERSQEPCPFDLIMDYILLPDGHEVEGAVAAALWDMWDDNNHDADDLWGVLHDGLKLDIKDIVSVIDEHDPTNVMVFYVRWLNDGYDDITDIMTLHNIVEVPLPEISLPSNTIEAKGNTTRVTSDFLLNIKSDDGTVVSPTVAMLFDITGTPGRTELPLGNHTVMWNFTARNAVGVNDTKSITAPQNITIQDTTPPRINITDIIEPSTGEYTNVDIWAGVSAADLVDPTPTLAHNAKIRTSYNEGDPTPIEETVFPLGVTIVNWNATDDSGNVATATQNVTIVGDDTPPTILAPHKTVEATNKTTPVNASWIIVTDIVDANPAISWVIVNNTDTPPTTYTSESLPLGNHTVSWTATDHNNNMATANQTITIVDTTPPDITVTDVYMITGVILRSTNDTAGLNASLADVDPRSLFVWSGFVDFENAVAKDIVDGIVPVTHNAPAFFTGVTVITWTATDNSGNTATAAQTVTIVDSVGDDLPPTISAPHKTIEATGPQTPVDTSWVTVTDEDDEYVTISFTPESLPLGNHTVSWTATDHNNNTATATQHITIRDTTPPDIDITDMTVSYSGVYTSIDIWAGVSATDLVDISPTLAHNATIRTSYNEGDPTPIEETVFPLGITLVQWTATDDSGNVGNATQTITVLNRSDVTPPVISAPHRTVEATGPQTPVNASWITVTDDTDTAITISFTPESLSLGNHTYVSSSPGNYLNYSCPT